MQRPEFDAPASEWLVYGDSLQQGGDPRGELVGLAGDPAARDQHAHKHWKTIVGAHVPEDGIAIDWHYDVAKGVTFRIKGDAGDGDADPVAAFLSSPVATQLRSITLVGVTGPKVDLTRSMATILEHAPATCTAFELVDERAQTAGMLVSRDFEPDENAVKFGSLAPFLARAESLKVTTADSHQLELGEFAAPNLRTFALHCLRFTEWEDISTMAPRFNAATFGKLEDFELRCVEQWNANIPYETKPYYPVYSEDEENGERYADEADEGESEGVNWAELAPLWSTLAKQPLKRLALTSFDSARTMIDALAAAKLPKLDTLDLSDASVTDEGAELIVASKIPAATLVLHGSGLTKDGVAALTKAGYKVDFAEGNGPTWRYVVGSE